MKDKLKFSSIEDINMLDGYLEKYNEIKVMVRLLAIYL